MEPSGTECNREGEPKPTALQSKNINRTILKRIITIDIEEDTTKIPFISFKHPVINDTIKLMLDTGSELNILKIKKISPLQSANLEETVFLKRVESVIISSIGTIELTLMGHAVKFHIVPDAFFIPFDGILGSEYFTNTKAKINFLTNHLIVGEKSIKFQQNHEPPTETRISGITMWSNN